MKFLKNETYIGFTFFADTFKQLIRMTNLYHKLPPSELEGQIQGVWDRTSQ